MNSLIKCSKPILKDRSGETIAEVVVAFALLSIMLVVFAQGIAWATNTQIQASDNRKQADDSMISLQNKLATEKVDKGSGVPIKETKTDGTPRNLPIRRYTYKIDDDFYVVYEAD